MSSHIGIAFSTLLALSSFLSPARSDSGKTYPVSDEDKSAAEADGANYGPQGQLVVPFSEYFWTPILTIKIGTPATPLKLMLDTGSRITWARSSFCRTGKDCTASLPKFTPTLVGQFLGLFVSPVVYTMDYSDGAKINFRYTKEVVEIGGRALTSQNVAALVASNTDGQNYDGIIGLGTYGKGDSSDVVFKFLDAYPSDKIFSLWYDNTIKTRFVDKIGASGKQHKLTPNAGEISFGPPDSRKYDGPIKWLSVIDDDHSSLVSFTWMEIDGKKITVPSDQATASLDTGASIMLLDQDLMDVIDMTIEGKGLAYDIDPDTNQRTISCTQAKDLPDITFNLGGHPFTLKGEDLYFKDEAGACALSIKPTFAGFNLIGSPFLRNFYSSFDMAKKKIGIAKRKSGK